MLEKIVNKKLSKNAFSNMRSMRKNIILYAEKAGKAIEQAQKKSIR